MFCVWVWIGERIQPGFCEQEAGHQGHDDEVGQGLEGGGQVCEADSGAT